MEGRHRQSSVNPISHHTLRGQGYQGTNHPSISKSLHLCCGLRLTFCGLHIAHHTPRFAFFLFTAFAIIWFFAIPPSLMLNAQVTRPAVDRHSVDSILGDDFPEQPARNLFFQVTSPVIKFLIFIALAVIIYGIVVIGFNNALEKDKPPLPAFFRFNTILILSVLVLGFLCFSEYTYRDENVVVVRLVDHFKNVNWPFWILLTALVCSLLAASKRRRYGAKSVQ